MPNCKSSRAPTWTVTRLRPDVEALPATKMTLWYRENASASSELLEQADVPHSNFSAVETGRVSLPNSGSELG